MTDEKIINEIKEILLKNKIKYNIKKSIWQQDGKKISKDVIKNLSILDAYTGFQKQESLEEIEKISDCETIKPVDASTYYVELFIEDAQRPLDERLYVPKTIPQMVIDSSFIELPYFARLEGEKADHLKLKEYFKLTCLENKSVYGSDNIDLQMARFDNYIDCKNRTYNFEIYDKIAYDEKYIDQAKEFCKKLYDFYKPSFVTINEIPYYSYELFEAILFHCCWCVKSKLKFGTCSAPVFLNIQGIQGNGKSEFARHLGQDIMKKLYAEVEVAQLNDNFGQGLWEKKLFCQFDDIDLEDKIGNGKLKRFITQKQKPSRGMRTEEFHETLNRATCFSTSNYAVWEIFPDKTGMRRYIDLKFTRDSIKDDTQAQAYIDKLWDENKLALWKAVNEFNPTGYLVNNEFSILLDKARTTYISSNDTVKKWLDKNNLTIVSSRCTYGETLDEVYENYCLYTDEKSICSLQNFKKRIQNMYTGSKLPPNKLKVAKISEAQIDTHNVSKDEINPFSDYIKFVPFEANENWRHLVPDVPDVPVSFAVPGEKNKNVGENCEKHLEHLEHLEPALPENDRPMNPIEIMIQQQNERRRNWNGKIEYKDTTNDEFELDNDNFFKRLKEGE